LTSSALLGTFNSVNSPTLWGRSTALASALLLCGAGCVEPQPTVRPPKSRVVASPTTRPTPLAAAQEEPRTEPRDVVPGLGQLIRVRDAEGGAGLLAELRRLPSEAGAAFAFEKQVFELLQDLNDPEASDELATFLAEPQHPYFETWAALLLGALGDLRAVPFLARRLRLDPLSVYRDVEWELPLKRDDSERVKSARVLADLAALHPEAHESLRAQSEDALWFWLHERPSPHANGLRALAAMRSRTNITELRGWSNPQLNLPLEGQQPPMPEEWVIAQSALRYVGRLQDAPSFQVLLDQLQRRPPRIDASTAGLTTDTAILAMSLRALGMGAADGLSEWGEPAAFQPLLKYIEDPLNHEQSRLAAAAALGWVGTEAELRQLAPRVVRFGASARSRFLQSCWLEALRARPISGLAPLLLPLLASGPRPFELGQAAARAMGRSRLDANTEAKLLALARRSATANLATLAVLLGGSSQSATLAIQSQGSQGASAELKDGWSLSVSSFSTDDVGNGTLFRYIENADALAATSVGGVAQVWARDLLATALKNLIFDDGPHSVTRVVLNDQLLRAAGDSDLRSASLAVRALTLLGEAGHLRYLGRAKTPASALAGQAYQDLLVQDAAQRARATR
jgi:HEAT repeat protein